MKKQAEKTRHKKSKNPITDICTDRPKSVGIVVALLAAIITLMIAYALTNNQGGLFPAPAQTTLTQCTGQTCPDPLRTLSLTTDMRTYHSNQNMWANITIESDTDSDADITLHGINAKGYDRISENTHQQLGKGRNIISISYQTPSCTGCAGILPGNYTITAEVKANGETKTASSMIEILQ